MLVLAVLTFFGYFEAYEMDESAVDIDVLPSRLFLIMAMMLAGTGVVGFLRKTLTEQRSVFAKLCIVGHHTGDAVCTCAGAWQFERRPRIRSSNFGDGKK